MFEEIPDEINHNTEDDDFDLFDVHELEKYMTPEEIAKGGSN